MAYPLREGRTHSVYLGALAPSWQWAAGRELAVTTFYRGPHARITDEVLEVRYPWVRQFAIRDLSQPRVIEHAADPPRIGPVRAGSTGVAGAATVAIAVGAAGGWPAFHTPEVAAAMIALLIVSVVVSGACWRLRAVVYELAAVYRGRPVRLYRSTDIQTFDQVKRGLLRALEQAADT